MRNYTWLKLGSLCYATEEQLDDTPDWYVYRDDGQLWYAKGRTSALRSGPNLAAGSFRRVLGGAIAGFRALSQAFSGLKPPGHNGTIGPESGIILARVWSNRHQRFRGNQLLQFLRRNLFSGAEIVDRNLLNLICAQTAFSRHPQIGGF